MFQGDKKPAYDKEKTAKQMKRAFTKNNDFLEEKLREEDKARAASQSRKNKEVIAENKPRAKKAKEAEKARHEKASARSEKARAKAATKEEAKAERKARQSRLKSVQPKALPWQKWVVMGHEKVADQNCCHFQVAMYGFPPKEGEDELWATRQNFVSDGAGELIDRYIRDHANYPPFSDLLIPTKREKKKAIPPPAPVDNSSPCRHEDYQGSYIKEDHPGHCKARGYLHALECSGVGCKKTFAADMKEVERLGKNMASRPTGDKPVYCCVNIAGRTGVYREEVCRHALCNECWSKAMLAGDDGKTGAGVGRRRATRTN